MVELVSIDSVKTAEPFEGLFPIDKSTLDKVCKSMEADGFDPCQPIILWKEKGIVIDGHTRLAAADSLKLDEVYVTEKSFQTEDAAVDYAIRCQRDRRNISDADLMRWVEDLDQRKKTGPRSDLASFDAKSGKSAAINGFAFIQHPEHMLAICHNIRGRYVYIRTYIPGNLPDPSPA
jgi:ParB family chromosome partitioning protein